MKHSDRLNVILDTLVESLFKDTDKEMLEEIRCLPANCVDNVKQVMANEVAHYRRAKLSKARDAYDEIVLEQRTQETTIIGDVKRKYEILRRFFQSHA